MGKEKYKNDKMETKELRDWKENRGVRRKKEIKLYHVHIESPHDEQDCHAYLKYTNVILKMYAVAGILYYVDL